MGDDWDYDDEDFMYDDPDYIYAEESWALADELASNALPQVPWIEVLDDGWGDYDMYEYFEDLEYGNDDYLDGEQRLDEEAHTGDKRKRGQPGKKRDKRRRLQDFDYTPVLWLPVDDAYRLELQKPVDSKTLPKYALLPDWRDRLKDAHGLMTATSTKPTKHVDPDAAMEFDGMGHEEADWEDEEDEEDEEEGEEEEEGEDMEDDEEMSEGLDPELLKSILAAKGIGAADQDAFLQSLMQMMSGGGEASGDILEDLTSKLLGRVADGGDDSTSEWLTRQGVSLDDEDHVDGNDEDTDANTSEPKPPAPVTKLLAETEDTDSPKDSVAEDVAKHETITSSKAPLPPTSMPEKAPTPSRKRKQVSFAPPNHASFQSQPEEEELVLEPRSNNKRPKRGLQPSVNPSTGKLNSIKSKQVAKGVSADKNSEQKPATSETSSPSEVPVPELKVTRKRKAAAQEIDAPAEKPKKQPRSGGFAAPTASSQRKVSVPLQKTTRSGRKRE